jgi:hypothetical protein
MVDIGKEEPLNPKDLEVTLGGKLFRTTPDTTFEQDMFVMDEIQAVGFEHIKEELHKDGEMTDKTAGILIRAYKSGHLFRLLSGTLVEVGKEWNPEDAKLNAGFFARLKDRESKETLQRQLLGIILSFLYAGSKLEETFRKSFGLEGLPESLEAKSSDSLPEEGIVEAPGTISRTGTL